MKPIYVIVTPYFPSARCWRGSYCYDFAVALMRLGEYDVRVLRPGTGVDYEYQGVKVYTFRQWRLPSATFPFLFARHNRATFLRKLNVIGVDIAKVAVCHAHTALLGDYALAVKQVNPRCQAVLHHHDLSSYGLDIGRLRVFRWYRLLLARALHPRHAAMDLHLFVSEASRQNFLSFPQAVNDLSTDYHRQRKGLEHLPSPIVKHAYVLHNGVNTQCFYPVRKSSATFTLGCVANFIPIKGHRYLLEALGKIRDRLGAWQLRLVGSGPTLRACQRLVRHLNLDEHVLFEPEMNHEALPAFYNALDLFVLPSYFEGFGCVCTEAYACGTPFIACRGQGLDELLSKDHGDYWLCQPQDANDLAKKILDFYQTRAQQVVACEIEINALVKDYVRTLQSLPRPSTKPPRQFQLFVEPTEYILDLIAAVHEPRGITCAFAYDRKTLASQGTTAFPVVERFSRLQRVGYLWRALKQHDVVSIHSYADPMSITVLFLNLFWRRQVRFEVDSAWREPHQWLARVAKRMWLGFWFTRPYVWGTSIGAQVHRDFFLKYGLPEARLSERANVVNNARTARPQPSEPTVAFRFGYVGRLVRHKAVDVLIEAFREVVRRYPQASLTIVGEGPERDPLRTQAADLPQVIFTGALYGREKVVRQHQMDALCLVSLYEPWGLVVNEALAAGTPCIVSACCGCAEPLICGPQAGVVVPDGDVAALIDAMVYLIEHPTEASAMGQRGAAFLSHEWNYARYARALDEDNEAASRWWRVAGD